MFINNKFWLKISIINLLLVAVLGLLMRYKIGFEFPFLDQKHLQHSHSHFAFSGWISHTLMVLMIGFLEKRINITDTQFIKKYNFLLIANLICSYGMLISFILQGYGLISILFSTFSIVIACVFTFFYFKDLKLISHEDLSKNWFKAALFFNVISSFGTFALAYMMATKNLPQDYYLSSIYFYLHFQYNGWFWFACVGLFINQLTPSLIIEKANKTIFIWFFISCI